MTAVFEQADKKPCDCCQEVSFELQPPENPPRQSTLNYRLGTYGSFLCRMIARLSEDQIPVEDPAAQRPLARLTARTTDDPAIALLDAWAVVTDILTFYQERIANEGYLRTATERFSVLQLARMIGYELSPGVAASTYLTFTAEAAPGAPAEVRVASGTRVLSIPGQDEKPQTFETVEDLLARAEWNDITPDRSATDVVTPLESTHVRLQGLSTGLNVGSGLLLEVDAQSYFCIVSRVEPVTGEGWTRVEWSEPVDTPNNASVGAHAFKVRAALLGHNAPDIAALSTAAFAEHLRRVFDASTEVGVAPSGTKIAAGSGAHEARVWAKDDTDLWHHERTVTLPADMGEVAVVAVGDDATATLPDNMGEVAVVAVGDDGTVAIGSTTGVLYYSDPSAPEGKTWDPEHGSAVSLLAFTANGSHLLARHADAQVSVWAPASDEKIADLQARSDVGTPPQRLVVVNPQGELSVFTFVEREEGDGWEETPLPTNKIMTVATLSGDGKRILAGSEDGFLYLWQHEDENGNGWGEVPVSFSAHTGRIHEVALSIDGKWGLSRGADRLTKLWKLSSNSSSSSDIPNAATATWRESTLDVLSEWPVLAQPGEDVLLLDAVYPSIVSGSRVVVVSSEPLASDQVVVSSESPAGYQVFEVEQADTVYASQMGVTAKVTRLRVSGGGSTDYPPPAVRVATVYAQSEVKALFAEETPLEEPVMGATLTLAKLHPELRAGRTLAVTGKRMRALIEGDACDGTRLVAADGFNAVEVSAGDVLEVLSAPVCFAAQPDDAAVKIGWGKLQHGHGFRPSVQDAAGEEVSGTIRWHLRDRNGFEGFLKVEVEVEVEVALDAGAQPGCEVHAIFAAENDPEVSEIATIRGAREAGDIEGRGRSQLELTRSLQNLFDRTTLHINANVALATHGETVEGEVLGGGDGSLVHQEFVLNKTPLTYVAAPTPSGGESTLEVRANDVLWDEVPSLYALDPRRRAYTVRHDNEGNAHLIFGDGTSGARLPSGLENIVARYRSGIGLEGEVGANSLKLLQVKPLGIREVTNPLAASGAAPPETLDQARANAPLKVLTLERVVSIRDFEDFAAAFSGVGKAKADGFRVGENQFVHITIANANGTPVDSASVLRSNLIAALNQVRDTTLQVRVDTFKAKYFRLGARVQIDTPTFDAEKVKAAICSALRSAFAFDKRGFGQDVLASEILQTIHQQAGVIAVKLTELSEDTAGTQGQGVAAESDPPHSLPALPARLSGNTVELAQLLLLSPADDAIGLEDFTP